MARRRSLLQSYKVLDIVVAFSFLAGVGVLVLFLTGKSEHEIAGGVKIIDGDSLRVDGEEVRLIGIDAPESKQFCVKHGKKWSCGREASRHLRQLVSRGEINCKGTGYDKYDRLLAKCSAGGVELNQMMVRDGWAVSLGNYAYEETKAEAAKAGIWAGKFDYPQDWRRRERRVDRWSN
ncbi:MAG: thermonuclease family protein [Rhizobiaceae bacterium]|nr:thermonuclease family protein [Rhizobiaceae bacterium]